jgi:hypothetical protein
VPATLSKPTATIPRKCVLVDHDGLLFLEDCGHYSSPLALENEPHRDFFPRSHAILRNDNLC